MYIYPFMAVRDEKSEPALPLSVAKHLLINGQLSLGRAPSALDITPSIGFPLALEAWLVRSPLFKVSPDVALQVIWSPFVIQSGGHDASSIRRDER